MNKIWNINYDNISYSCCSTFNLIIARGIRNEIWYFVHDCIIRSYWIWFRKKMVKHLGLAVVNNIKLSFINSFILGTRPRSDCLEEFCFLCLKWIVYAFRDPFNLLDILFIFIFFVDKNENAMHRYKMKNPSFFFPLSLQLFTQYVFNILF